MDRESTFVKQRILASGTDDWVHIVEVSFAARLAMYGDHIRDGYPDAGSVDAGQLAATRDKWSAEQERQSFPIAIRAVKELVRDGLVQIGYTTDAGFVPWEGALEEIDERIDAVAATAEFPLLPGDLFWLNNTPEGDAVARSDSDGSLP